ncbi:MAG: hypothetical protein Q9212_006227 [Teloschistes hypoglaucus]
MPYTISLNGADNVGKTTQIELLPRHYTLSKVGGIHPTDPKIGGLHQRGLLSTWWWDSSNEDFACSIFSAVARRHWGAMAVGQDSVTIYDRGPSMFEAVVVAVMATKSLDHDLAKARTALQAILTGNRTQMPKENLAILLQHGSNLEESVSITMSRESNPNDERYKLYQRLLQSELKHQEQSGVYDYVIKIETASSIGEIQDKIREVIQSQTQNQLFTPILHRLDHVFAFSGLSERLKIVYVDTEDAKRFERALVPPEAVVANDNLKRERGVELIRGDADLVLNNNGSLPDTIDTLLRFAENCEKRDKDLGVA